MKLKKYVSIIGICSVMVLSSSLLTDCTAKITDEQLMKLQELRKKESQLNQEISGKQSEISKIERELSSKKAELDNCQKDREFVKKKLSQWPNVWQD